MLRKKKIFIILGIILSLFIIIGNIGTIFIYHKTNTFFNKITNVKYEITNYSIISSKDTGRRKSYPNNEAIFFISRGTAAYSFVKSACDPLVSVIQRT